MNLWDKRPTKGDGSPPVLKLEYLGTLTTRQRNHVIREGCDRSSTGVQLEKENEQEDRTHDLIGERDSCRIKRPREGA